jgi:predicted NBD/HSP70 family sugar kinase
MGIYNPGRAQGKSIQDIKIENYLLVFESIRSNKGISRADLARSTSLTPSTITNIVKELVNTGLVIEDGYAKSSGGRKPAKLRINDLFGYAVGISLTRSWISGVIADLNLKETVQRISTDSSLSNSANTGISNLITIIRNLILESGIPSEKIIGIGISAPGPLDSTNGMLISPPNFPGWTNIDLRRAIEEEIRIATFLDNDANSSALAEKWFGDAKDLESFVFIEADTGVGAGIVICGDLYRGKSNLAGEIGHMTIDPHGAKCGCGNYGCLELYASPNATTTKIQNEIKSGKKSILSEWYDGKLESLSFEMVTQAANEGDTVAKEAIISMAEALSIGVINLIHSFNPEAIFIGGTICKADTLLFDIVRKNVHERCMSEEAKQTPIINSRLGTEAPLIGALSLVLREAILNLDNRFMMYGFSPLPLHLD